MSTCAGIDLSSRAIDIVKLDEDTNQAEWFRFELEGASAWERTRQVRDRLPGSSWWEDVYLAAIETPFPDQQGVLRRVQGAVMASIPPAVLVWEANAAEWKRELALKGKPSWDDLYWIAPGWVMQFPPVFQNAWDGFVMRPLAELNDPEHQNARDAYCIALWARETNRRGIEAA